MASVGENSPAAKAGLKSGDIILEFDGKKIETMRALPKVVANTKVGKSVVLKIWRDKKIISKRLILGRLESSKEFKADNKKLKSKTKKEAEIEIIKLKISVRDLNEEDIKNKKLKKDTKGIVITEISKSSPLFGILNKEDIILEIQKKPIDSKSFSKSVEKIINDGEKTLLLTILNKQNQRRYLGVKIN